MTALLAAAFAVAGCERGSRDEVRDDSPPDTAAWALEEEPAVRVGAAPGEPEREFYRVYAGFVASDGSIVVGNSGTGEIWFFDARGRFRGAKGRKGEGPGEFQSVSWLAPTRGDSIVVFDMRARRFSVLGPDGEFVRSFQLAAPGVAPRPLGLFPDGTLLVAAEGRFDPRAQTGVVRDTVRLLRVDREGEVMDSLGELPGAEWLTYNAGSSFRSEKLTFGRTGFAALAGDRIVAGSSESSELHLLDGRGSPLGTLRVPGARRRLSRREAAERIGPLLEDLPPARKEATRRHLEGMGLPEEAPVFTDLRADRDGNVWVQLSVPPESGFAKWIVLSLDGSQVGSVWAPRDLHPLDIGGDVLLARRTDGDGVERVTLYRVRR